MVQQLKHCGILSSQGMPEHAVIKELVEKATSNAKEHRWGDPRSQKALTVTSMQAMLSYMTLCPIFIRLRVLSAAR